jgi:hypothetical protein
MQPALEQTVSHKVPGLYGTSSDRRGCQLTCVGADGDSQNVMRSTGRSHRVRRFAAALTRRAVSAPYDDGEFDYRSLTKAEIEYAIRHIDGSTFPKNLANARAALEARNSGASEEPAPILDEATEAKYTFRVERFLGVIIAAYAVIGLGIDDLMIPYGGRVESDRLVIIPRFK